MCCEEGCVLAVPCTTQPHTSRFHPWSNQQLQCCLPIHTQHNLHNHQPILPSLQPTTQQPTTTTQTPKKTTGCCPAHSPLLPQDVQLPPLPPALTQLLQPLLRLVLLQVMVTLEGESE